jgi:hypothetical protein
VTLTVEAHRFMNWMSDLEKEIPALTKIEERQPA